MSHLRSVLALLFLACSGHPEGRAPSTQASGPLSTYDSIPASVDSARAALDAVGERFGGTEREIRATLGAPVRVRQEVPFGEPYASSGDSAIFLEYPNMTFGIYRVIAEHRDLLAQVIVNDSSVLVAPGIQIGALRQTVISRFGRTVEGEHSDSLTYQTSLAGNIITFVLKDDRITSFRWSYFID